MSRIDTVLFDLDGTLVDTAPDMGAALNRLRAEHGEAPLTPEEIRPWVSHGSPGLLKLAFGIDTDHHTYIEMRERFLDLYVACLADDSGLFPAFEKILPQLEESDIRWGIVTNKPGWLTDPLLEALQLDARAACVVSGDTLKERKPHPAPVLHAMEIAGAKAEHTVYVGDAARDIEAGRAAGCRTLAAAWGYFPDNDHPETWQADAILDQPDELIDWLAKEGRVNFARDIA
ncbi:MAG: phosphoglycolate phosphatase [Gammaproteobacteria bacterium]|nr:phosphoglycolate phosphatase [Gammaproteobacteria bacterium]